MGFWTQYKAGLKPVEVEEPIDRWLHRPLAYLVARAVMPLGISADVVTLLSIVAGVSSAFCFVATFPWHLPLAGFLLFFSAVLDCADGQIARMTGTSSPWGRMLDGCADLVTVGAAAPALVFDMWRNNATPSSKGITLLVLAVATIVTSSFHTTMYDHYKNVWVRFTGPFKEGEDYESALARFEATPRRELTAVGRVAWPVYLFYVKSQRDAVLQFDPWTSARVTLFPPYDPERGAMYRKACGPVMKVWRTWFGFGSLIFGMSVFGALGHIELYLGFRLVVLNLVFYGWLRGAQRRASAEAFRRMDLHLPDQRAPEAA